ncbi:hypothetical protein H7K20_06400 [Priestia aryabhattai]|uniref:hypothetical protein n=1 Tax=Priestia aryabhattai TaxID=412384 RepID=UPI001C8EE17D|nr:hypothetical protein [Priestia aryabhattai]MBY0026717.1 hypothetical protein [Priestia aryabhattai]
MRDWFNLLAAWLCSYYISSLTAVGSKASLTYLLIQMILHPLDVFGIIILFFTALFCLSAAVRKVFLQSRLFLKGYKVKWHEYLVSCLCVIGILSLSTIALYQVVGLLTIATIYALSSLTETHRV